MPDFRRCYDGWQPGERFMAAGWPYYRDKL